MLWLLLDCSFAGGKYWYLPQAGAIKTVDKCIRRRRVIVRPYYSASGGEKQVAEQGSGELSFSEQRLHNRCWRRYSPHGPVVLPGADETGGNVCKRLITPASMWSGLAARGRRKVVATDKTTATTNANAESASPCAGGWAKDVQQQALYHAGLPLPGHPAGGLWNQWRDDRRVRRDADKSGSTAMWHRAYRSSRYYRGYQRGKGCGRLLFPGLSAMSSRHAQLLSGEP